MFDWDEANREKCAKHGVSITDIEALFTGEIFLHPDPRHSSNEERFKGIGKTATGRHVLVVFTWREREGRNVIRPISARYMHRKEIAHYEAEAAKPSDG